MSPIESPVLRKSSLPGTFWPPVSLGANAALAAMVWQLEATERFTPGAIKTMQYRQLAAVAVHHYGHSPTFAARLRSAGLSGLDSQDQLRRLAPIGRRETQEAGERFFAGYVPEAHRPVHEVRTSGSTGEPVTVRKTELQTLLWTAMTLRDLLWHGYDFSGRITTVRPQVSTYYERAGWGRPIDDLYVSGPAQGIPMGTDIREQLRLMREFKPQVLVAIPANLKAMAEIWEAEGFEPASLRRIRTIGETVNEDLRALVARTSGCMIEDHYSAQEVGSIAVQCPSSDLYHVMAESLIVEVLNEAGEPCVEGESGRVVVTDLHNLATPLIRYEVGDWAEVGGACPCGRGLPTLRRILGRERNLVLMPDGRRHWPLLGQMGRRFLEAAPVRQFQLIQTSRTEMRLRVVAARPLTSGEVAALTQAAQTILGYPFEFTVTFFDGKLPTGANGKFEHFMCRVVTPTDIRRPAGR